MIYSSSRDHTNMISNISYLKPLKCVSSIFESFFFFGCGWPSVVIQNGITRLGNAIFCDVVSNLEICDARQICV